MNISLVGTKCVGCGICSVSCPVSAIEMIDDDCGFRRAKVSELCIDCSKCNSVCPGTNSNSERAVLKEYGCRLKDDKKLLQSQSGGAFFALASTFIENDGIVYGAASVEPKTVMHIRVSDKSDLHFLVGSKYVQSNIETVFSSINRDLKEGKRVLFSGTPCQCEAISRSVSYSLKSNLLLCDIICHGVPSPGILCDYIDWFEAKYSVNIKEFIFRDKKRYGWRSSTEQIESTDGKQYYSRRYTKLFNTSLSIRESCFDCKYTSKERIADITIGDFWKIKESNPEMDDNKGVSHVIIRTSKGLELYSKAKNLLIDFDCTEDKISQTNLERATKRPELYEQFWNDYVENGFEFVSKKYGHYDFVHRIKYIIKDKIYY